jgi:hypothetical protein
MSQRAKDQSKTFDDFIQDVKDQVEYEEDGAVKHARANARKGNCLTHAAKSNARSRCDTHAAKAGSQVYDDDRSEDEYETASDTGLRRYINNVNVMDRVGGSYYMGRKAFKLLKEIAPDVLEKFRERRREELRKSKSKPGNDKGELPKQYSKPLANAASAEDDDFDDDDSSFDSRCSGYHSENGLPGYETLRSVFHTLKSISAYNAQRRREAEYYG